MNMVTGNVCGILQLIQLQLIGTLWRV